MLLPTAFSEGELPPLMFGDELRAFLAEREVVGALYFELLPGDVIYISSSWWHALINIESNLVVTFNFLDAYSLDFAYVLGSDHISLLDSIVLQEINELQKCLDSTTLHGEVLQLKLVRLEIGCVKRSLHLATQADRL